MKVLTAAEMREVDRKTSELGIPGIVLMENAAHRVVEFLVERFGPLKSHRVVVFCGKGNNGGDGLAIARQLFTRCGCKSLDILLACPPEQLTGDAAANFQMLVACGGRCQFEIEAHMQATTLIVDALLGTGLTGPARGKALEWIRAINAGFPEAKVLCVDVPSGMPSDTGEPDGEFVRARDHPGYGSRRRGRDRKCYVAAEGVTGEKHAPLRRRHGDLHSAALLPRPGAQLRPRGRIASRSDRQPGEPLRRRQAVAD